MRSHFFAVTFVLGFSISCSSLKGETHRYSRRQLNNLEHSAQSEAEYHALQVYFAEQSQIYQRLAEAERETWRKELDHPTAGTKYPTEAERARRLNEYYSQRSRLALQKCEEYGSKVKQRRWPKIRNSLLYTKDT